jgi:hypothetical protein
MNPAHRSLAAIIILALFFGWTENASAARAPEKLPVPDFTQGGKKDEFHDWTLGRFPTA